MDIENEKAKLQALLTIPIDEIRFSNFFCEIYYRGELIGFLPFIMSSEGIQYEVTTSHLQKLNWQKICYLNATELTTAVATEISKATFKIVPSSFRRLFIEDFDNNLFASFECQYKDHSWLLKDENILVREK